jgi:alanine racemase
MKVMNFFKKYLRPDIVPLNTIEISQASIVDNYRLWKQIQPSYQIIPILKSNAYGHGLRAVSQILSTINTEIQMVGVDSFPEYQIVRDQTPFWILLLNETNHHNYRYFDFTRTAFAVYTLETLRFLWSLGEQIFVHIFFNTGMNREGFQMSQIDQVAALLKQYPNLQIQWVMSHFASSQSLEPQITHNQLELYKTMYAKLKTQVVCSPTYLHISNTCGMTTVEDPLLTAGRVWIGLYGYTSFDPTHPSVSKVSWLKHALSLYSMITCTQELVPGDYIWYDQTTKVSVHSKIALLPVGYREGLPKSLSNQRNTQVKWIVAPVCGLISMNLMTINISGIEAGRHDRVTVISSDMSSDHTIVAVARTSNMSIYEVLIWLDSSIRRVVVA